MAEQQSSLRTAIDKIMGWPAGGEKGATGGGVTPTPASAPTPANAVANLATTSAVENLVPEAVADPFEAQLAEIRAQNDALSASLAGTATPASPVAATPADTLDKGYASSYSTGYGGNTYKIGAQGNPDEWITLTSANINDPWIQESMKGSLTNLQNNTAKMAQTDATAGAYAAQNNAINAWNSLIANPGLLSTPAYTTPAAPTRAPVNPGSKAPWQQSQQYWKDLAAYNAGK